MNINKMRNERSGIIGMMAGSTHPRTGRIVMAEAEMLRLLEFVNVTGELIDRLEIAEKRDAAAPVAYITKDRRHLIFADSPNMLPADKTGLTALVEKPASAGHGKKPSEIITVSYGVIDVRN